MALLSLVKMFIISTLITFSYARFEEIRSQHDALKYLAKQRYASPDLVEVSPILQPLIKSVIDKWESQDLFQQDTTIQNETTQEPMQNDTTPEPIHNGTTPEPMPNGTTPEPIHIETTQIPVTNSYQQCKADLSQMVEDFLMYTTDKNSSYYYAIMMVDSYGKLPPGVMQGHTQWIGLFDQCLNQTQEYTQKNFGAQYCIAHTITEDTKAPLLSVGICVPDSCTESDLYVLMEQGILELNMKNVVAYASCNKEIEYNAGAISCLVFLSIIGAFIVAGTGYELLTIYGVSKDDPLGFKTLTEEPDMTNHENGVQIRPTTGARGVHMMHTEPGNNSYINSSTTLYNPVSSSANPSINGSAPLIEPIGIHDPPVTCSGFFKKFILCFSLVTNGSKILSPKQGQGSLHALNGIRVLSLFWVILGHTYFFPLTLFSNPIQIPDILGRFSFQAVGNATFSVDSFFFMSGLLITYLTLNYLKKKDGKLNWGMFYLHRFLRLTPVYMIVIYIYTTLTPHFATGPMYSAVFNPNPVGYETGISYCQKYWWTNLLYINNVYPNDLMQECLGWSWYLANDMQFFIISPFIIYFLYHKAPVGIGICIGLLLTCFGSLIGLTISKDLEATPFPQNASRENFLGNSVYTKPYARISTYLVGMVLGYILYLCQGKVKMSRFVALLGWLVATVIGLSVVYGLYGTLHGNELNKGATVMYITFCRFAWAVALGWVSFACITGYGGPVNTLLSWPVWIPLSRINYCAYLLHPIIMMVFQYSLPTLIYFSDFLLIYFFLGNIVLSYSAAFIFSVCVEAPFMALEKLIFQRDRSV
ncbi:nose resistant to fluoxetine protein 6-like [Antedon mediterranea]|uniref:nose resistant to fluoxetine protein 6-like n=1 Tax=Antedon mediterranea TaxID=105859 RepID=UPI003AF77043